MAKMKFDIGKVVLIILLAAGLLWLFGQFFTVSEGSISFIESSIGEAGTIGFQTLQYLIGGVMIYFAVMIVSRFTKESVSRKDIFTIILMSVGLILFWKYIASPVLGAPSLTDIAWKFGMKTGLLK